MTTPLRTRNVRPSVAGPLFWRVLHWSTLVAPRSRETAVLWTCIVDAMGCPACRSHFCEVLAHRSITRNTELTAMHGVLLHGDVNTRLGRVPFPAGTLVTQTEVLQRRFCAGLMYLCPRELASLLLMIAMGAEREGDNPARERGTALFVNALITLVCQSSKTTDGGAWRQLGANCLRLPPAQGGKKSLFLHIERLFHNVPGVQIARLTEQLNACAFAEQ